MADQACPSSSTQNNLVQQLCRLVENLNEQNNTTQRRADTRDNRPETVGEAISRLFPSVNGRSNSSAQLQVTTTQGEASGTSSDNHNGALNGIPRFEAQRGTSKQGKRKKPYSKKKTSGSPGVMKDVILLPNPRMKLLPRGRIREELYVRGFVATAVNITNEMTALEIEGNFATLFSNKLRGRPFNFVRAVGNKIVDVNLAQGITGKILKHICGQGPVYLRCVRPTDTEYAWVEEEDSEDDGINEADGGESDLDDLPESGACHTVSTPVTAHRAEVVQVDDNVTSRSNTLNSVPSTGNILQYFSTPASSTSNQSLVACPTCHVQFPVREIELHADQCCDRVSSEASLYGTWVLNPIDLTGENTVYYYFLYK